MISCLVSLHNIILSIHRISQINSHFVQYLGKNTDDLLSSWKFKWTPCQWYCYLNTETWTWETTLDMISKFNQSALYGLSCGYETAEDSVPCHIPGSAPKKKTGLLSCLENFNSNNLEPFLFINWSTVKTGDFTGTGWSYNWVNLVLGTNPRSQQLLGRN